MFYREKVQVRFRILRSLATSYGDMYGEHIPINVVDAEPLTDAQQNPDHYRNLMVRVAGYSAYFIELDKEVQDKDGIKMKLYGLLGEKLGHSMSPQIHNKIMSNIGVDGQYALIEVKREDLPRSIEALKVLNYSGVSVTIPYKQLIMRYLDEISPEASCIGAVNVVDFKNGKTIGYNTDYFGFDRMLKKAEIEVEGKDVVQLGAGGIGNTVTVYLHNTKVKSIRVVARDEEKLAVLNKKFPYINTSLFSEKDLIKGDIIVNATSVGMFPNVNNCAIDKNSIGKFAAAVDTIYNPIETMFLKFAKELGLKATGGLSMLIYQAIKAQEIWQEREIDNSYETSIYKELSKFL